MPIKITCVSNFQDMLSGDASSWTRPDLPPQCKWVLGEDQKSPHNHYRKYSLFILSLCFLEFATVLYQKKLFIIYKLIIYNQ